MKPQLFIGKKPQAELLQPVKNKVYHCKPEGGLWTSTHLTGGISDWTRWCEAEQWSTHSGQEWQKRWLLTPVPDTHIATINSLLDLEQLLARYEQRHTTDIRITHRVLDFEQLAKEYDGIHLTESGQWATRFGEPNLYGWDCESTLWFHWSFTKVKQLNGA